jgi:hypothetical protein
LPRIGDNEAPIPLKIWEPGATTEGRAQTISPQLAAAQRDHYQKLGVEVVYFDNDPRIPFDGAVDPKNPNTLFLSNNPQRNATQVGAHEVTHILESTTLPDGTNLGDVLLQQIQQGVTEAGMQHARERFTQTAPDRSQGRSGPCRCRHCPPDPGIGCGHRGRGAQVPDLPAQGHRRGAEPIRHGRCQGHRAQADRWHPAAQDSKGNPIVNRQAVAARDRLLDELGSIRVPDGPLEMLLNHFGTTRWPKSPDVVSASSGRRTKPAG